MLYNYKLTLSQMGQIKNYKKDKNFTHDLLGIQDIELSTYEVDCEVKYKKTVPLNMFEKYSIRLIEKADEIDSDMNIQKIAQLLHLDKKIIKDNLENLEAIGMLNGVKSDIITINRNDNSYYLQYENKFKIDSIKEKYHLTKDEYESIKSYIQREFEKNSKNRDKKFHSVFVKNEKESIKSANLLNYSDNQFLIFSKDGINSQNDLKFIDNTTFSKTKKNQVLPKDIFCHYDEFLPLLRDKLGMNRDSIVVVSSEIIEDSNLDIFKANKNPKDIYILTHDEHENDRVFNVKMENFVLFGDDYYLKDGDFIFKKNANEYKKSVFNNLKNYFIEKIIEIVPEYNFKEMNRINLEVNKLHKELETFELTTKNEIESKIKTLNEDKNKSYGLTNNNSKARAIKRKEIDKLESQDKDEELKKYPIYLKNREKIFGLKMKVVSLEKELKKLAEINKSIDTFNKEKSCLVPKNKKSKVTPLENELKNIQRLLDE